MHHFWNHLLRPAFDALKPESIVEIGAAEGLNTVQLAAYASEHAAKLTIIDPFPRFDLAALKRRFPADITLLKLRSLEAFPTLERPDVILIDGDHNWYTVLGEFRAILKIAGSAERFPVVFVHDTGWPYAERDMYFFPGDIPEHSLQPKAIAGVEPGRDLLVPSGGLNARMYHALTPGGPRNGVLTAVNDFFAEASGIKMALLPGFHGIGIVYPERLPASSPAFRTILENLRCSPLLERHIESVETDRLAQVARVQELRRELFRGQIARHELRELVFTLRRDMAGLKSDIARMLRTRSWKLTAPVRQAEVVVRALGSASGWVRLSGSIWEALGKPFPGAARFVRHRLLGRSVPAAAPAGQAPRVLADRVEAIYSSAPSVSVIVTARNNAPFIKECLESILSQSIPPFEVIYCDDGSTDDSLAIVRSIRGVTVLERKHEGVVKARNAAVAVSSGSLLLHVDGDDALTPGFIAEQLAALANAPDAVFAYGGSVRCDMETTAFAGLDWSAEELWHQNYINTSSTIRRSAFEAVGGWQDGVGTLWDWHLWLRLTRLGRGVRSGSVLKYRRHLGSWSNAVGRHMDDRETGLLMGRVRRAVAGVSVCCIFGGRVPELLPLWMDSLAASIRAHIDTAQTPELIVLDNSGKHVDRIRALAIATGVFRSVTVVPYPEKFSWTAEMERRHKVSMFLAKAYNRLLALADGEIVWFLEDDVVVPEHAYDTLLRDLTDGIDPVAAASGLYRNRHQEDWIAHHVDAVGRVLPVDVSAGNPMEIDLAGTGCLMALRPFVPYPFTSHWRGHAPAHDWTWSERIRRDGKKILLDPRVRCRHYADTVSFV